MKETHKTSVRLLSWTQNPIETVYAEWLISRTDGPVPSPDQVHDKIVDEKCEAELKSEGGTSWEDAGPFEKEVRKVFEDCVAMKVPIAETISFVFEIDHMPISLREQFVRHRIGHKYSGGDGLEVQLVPDIADSSFWSQTFRAKDMGKFYTDGEYLVPQWLEENAARKMPGFRQMSEPEQCLGGVKPKVADTMLDFWHEQMGWIQSSYRRLVAAGMPLEDARNILPLGVQHRMTWSTNLSALMHILSKRGCWIAQLGVWEPVVRGIVSELAEKVDPYFRTLISPPCIGADDKFAGCKFHKENDEYIKGTDPHHPCPLWLHHHPEKAIEASEASTSPTWSISTYGVLQDKNGVIWAPIRGHVRDTPTNEAADFAKRTEQYAELWGRDPYTGERKRLA